MAHNLEWGLCDLFFFFLKFLMDLSLKERRKEDISLQNLLPSCDIVLVFFFFLYYIFQNGHSEQQEGTMAKIHTRAWNLGLGAPDPTFPRLLTRKGHPPGERTK